jgi:magnesium transporter
MQQKGNRVTIEEIDIFWGRNYIITVHTKNLNAPKHLARIDKIFRELRNDKIKLNNYFSKGPDYLLYKLLNEMVLMIFSLMYNISSEIDYLDTNYDKLKASNVIERMSALRRNIIFLQTSLKPQKSIFSIFENQLIDQEKKDMDIYWGDIGDHIGKLLDMAEDYQELIEGLYSSIDMLLTFKMNNIMKTLTLFSVIMLPLTFITGFYGMNIKLPFQEAFGKSLVAAGLVTGIMVIISVVMLIFFRIRRF